MRSESDTPAFRDGDIDLETRVDDLVERMTLAEKAGQVTGTWGGNFRHENDVDDLKTAISEAHIGAAAPFGWGSGITRDPAEAAAIVNELQRHAMDETRLGIPLLFNVDAVHGHAYITGATVFPNGLGAAATWDPEGVEKAASVTAGEVRATGAHQNYGPTTDVARDPRWGRAFETFGESPHLVGELVAAKVRGYQGSGVGDPEGVVATAKHFPAYSEPERGEDAAPVDVSEYKLRNTFVAPFERALSEDVRSVMPSYNSINGEPSHGSVSLLRSLLRDELGFDGHVVSDWDGIRHIFEDHGTAHNHASAVKQARQAGLDIASVGHIEHADRVIELVEDGDLTEDALDTSVRRVLRLKFELGLFEEPFVDEEAVTETLGNDDHREVARQSARDSMTLLKNDDLLPLSGDEDVFVGGPNADDMVHQLGGWSVDDDDGIPGETILEAISASTSGTVTHAQGTTLNETMDVDDAVEKAAAADVAVLALGEGWYLHEFGPAEQAGVETGEWPTRTELRLSAPQRELVQRVHETDTPVVGVLVTGRPLVVDWMAEHVPAILMAYFPGTEGGVAIAETLFGENDPSGRLPITIPSSTDALPQTFDHLVHPTPIGDHEHPDSYDPLYPFGHGLSYTTFETDDLAVAYDTDADAVTVEVDVSNVGDRTGTEIVQIYARQLQASRVRPNRSLVGFDRVTVEPGETVRATVELPTAAFEYHVPNVGTVLEPGPYRIDVDAHSETVELPEDA
ncbi:glycoside hydrolase family 3 N-terminal domain-containing protein [Natrialba sp. INN-245]|uniref:glycoside hydrolase family 3 N-terminal domain-containing protein n=1 Tax=Natrialba sp. INN-245 TaxID=2690967 RepID=UPI00190FAA8E|nr:glycoside hydrolase family 3 N-terminal domain-containing protein [Natrialba sp. INN-245]